jgi:valyl-tRNA synthetase
MKMDNLANPAILAVEEGKVKFIPDRWKKVYFDWMYNIKDWCLSRQLWWGHRIPAWYCNDCGHINVDEKSPDKCENCGSSNLKQDDDVLDTWFSSALWPLGTLGWPEDTEDLKYFYPTSVLSTARDIINLWVARMIMMGLEFKKDVPFYHVYVHPTVLTREGKRMSKSKGTGVDPLDLINKYGADVTRFGLAIQCTEMQDLRFHEENFENTRNFTNKIWNASRFVISNLEDRKYSEVNLEYHLLSLSDKWILSRLQKEIKEVTDHLENYRFSEYVKTIYNFFWNEFCDWYIEMVKPRLSQREDPESRLVAQTILWKVLRDNLKLLHPVMPFITEEIWHKLPESSESIMISSWPITDDTFINEKAEKDMEFIMELIRTIRAIRAEFNISPSDVIKVDFYTLDKKKEILLLGNSGYFSILAKAEINKIDETKDFKNVVHKVFEDVDLYVNLKGLIDITKEKERIKKELEEAINLKKKIEERLSNEEFLRKAPEHVVEKEKEKLESINKKIRSLEESFSILE